MIHPPPDGKHVAMARFRLAESFHQSGNPAATRMKLGDLLEMINVPADETPPMVVELATANAQLFTHANGDFYQAVKACRDYLTSHPVGSRAMRAAWMFAEALQTAGRTRDPSGQFENAGVVPHRSDP